LKVLTDGWKFCKDDALIHFLLLITQCHRLGKLQRKKIYFSLWFLSKVKKWHMMMPLLAEFPGGTGHHMVRDREHTRGIIKLPFITNPSQNNPVVH
jgi:hypothetical protein